MRLDKYLKVSRLIKRRTVAKDVCDGEKVSLNHRLVKPSAQVNPGDIITINMKNRVLEVKVLETPANVRAEQADTLYEVLQDRVEAMDN
ncbi:MAG: RNA-binding S4 domain-containing protein [Peptococcaceae bacterium]|jgi:ribosomal 50S subunit-recycling heat shock protein|nr:RNA-binding S4 domain-containing protein [Peptococcaceae bacterium]MDR2736112.1 RNA-binding S4 domain-containing protein [Gracilibacteraceae bacterium]